eukprot:15354137-Ditylum_brightwellii.AAC.1
MSSSKTNIDYKNNYFKYPELTPLHGEPTTAALLNLHSKVRSKAQLVDTMLGGATAYLQPLNPGQLSVTATATQAQITQLQDQHEESLHLFQEVTNIECAIIQQIVKTID